jgi:preprotein translocase subunit SecD
MAGLAALIALSVAGDALSQSSEAPVAPREPIIQLRLAQNEPAPGFVRMELLSGEGAVYVAERSILSDDDIEQVGVHRDGGRMLLDVHYSPAAGARLREATTEGVGRFRIAVLIQSRLINAPPIASPIGGLGRVTIGGELPPQFAEAVAAKIAARWPQ